MILKNQRNTLEKLLIISVAEYTREDQGSDSIENSEEKAYNG